jgi:hypothetical protein
MSEKLLDLAVEEACSTFNLPEDHFLRSSANINAAKNMIAGDSKDVGPEKAWLYTIVCNKNSGVRSTAIYRSPLLTGSFVAQHMDVLPCCRIIGEKSIHKVFGMQVWTLTRWTTCCVISLMCSQVHSCVAWVLFNVELPLFQLNSECQVVLTARLTVEPPDTFDVLMKSVLRSLCADKPCKFQRREQLKELLDCARVVVNQKGETEIGIDMSCGTVFIERVNDVFQARAIMHEKVYQSGCANHHTGGDVSFVAQGMNIFGSNVNLHTTALGCP